MPGLTRCFGAACLGLFALFGCRKLPGPDECQRVAAAVLGVSDAAQLAEPRVKQRFDEMTQDCLLTPYDRELVRCVDETKFVQRCLDSFQRRLANAAEERQRAERRDPSEPSNSVRRW